MLDKKLRTRFSNLGFRLRRDGNYRKRIVLDSDESIHDTALEIMKIFRKIYKVDKQTWYQFDDLIDDYQLDDEEEWIFHFL